MEQQSWISNLGILTVRAIASVSRWMTLVAAIALGLMMLLTAADAGGRYLFSFPIKGADDLIAFLLICAGTWGLADCEIRGAHVTVDILVDRLPPRLRALLVSIAYIVTIGVFSLIAWQSFARGARYMNLAGEASEVLGIPFWPFLMALGFSFGMLCLTLLLHLLQNLKNLMK